MGRFRYTFDVLTNRKTFRDLKESSPLRKLLETVRSELSKRDKDIADEVIGSGDDAQTQFTGRLTHPALKPRSLVIHAVVVGGGTETFTDNGDGTLKSDASPPGTGTIDYTYGNFDVTFNTAPKDGENVYADYIGFLEFVSYGLNKVYDARFITKASGEDLDRWGETLGLPRSTTGDPPKYVDDEVYRADLLAELRDFTACLTADAIKDAVESLPGVNRPDIVEIYTLAPDWPLGWDDVDAPYTTWVPWDNLVDLLLVLDSEPGGETLEDIAEKVIQTKFAPARCFIVTENLGGYYDLVRLVG